MIVYKCNKNISYIPHRQGVGTFYFQGGLLKKLVIYNVSAGVVINDVIYIFEISEVLDVWKQNFCSLFTSECKDTISILYLYVFHICLSEMNNILMNERIFKYEVEFALNRPKLNKAVQI